MELIPAIDLRGGRVVRLVQGDFERATDYGDDPVGTARRWASEGATRLHLVDLDGAREGRPVQSDIVRRVVAAVDIRCQVAGGIRSEGAARVALGAGADRVVLGTALLRDPDLAGRLVQLYGQERVVAAIDVRDGSAVGNAWRVSGNAVPVGDSVRRMWDLGIEWFAVTAIVRDGSLEGPDLELLDTVAGAVPDGHIIASGGVTSIEDVRRLAGRGFAAAIVGRALYEGVLSLREAIAASGGKGRPLGSHEGWRSSPRLSEA